MKKVIMMLALVGGVMSANAQELSKDYKQKSIESSMAVVENDISHQHYLTGIAAKKTNGLDLSYPYVKEVLRNRYGKIGDNEDLERFINSNPTAVNYFKTSESYLYSLGLSEREIKYLKEYMTSTKK